MTPCIEHSQALGRPMYASIRQPDGTYKKAHRLALSTATGHTPPDMLALHKCDNKRCINPEHLYWGTHQQNMLDSRERGTSPRGTRNCKAKLTEEAVRMIRAELARGVPTTVLAEQWGVAPYAIRKIRNSKTWVWLA